MYHKSDAFDKFEEISALVKKTHLSFSDPKRDFELNELTRHRSPEEVAREVWIVKSRNLLNEVNKIKLTTFRSTTAFTAKPNILPISS